MSEPERQTSVDIDQLAINTIRFLSVDMVQAANSGHPGAPMGQAAMAYVLWTRHLRHAPNDPEWLNRDRFILSCGHASALLYSLLHLSGYGLSLDEIRNFRQLGSRTPGHPENFLTRGVETTTGPLGQGVGNALGMALGEQLLASRFNRDGFAVFDFRTWVFASDGDLMEGVAAEACSLAGHLGLGKLNVFYDDNRITIDGSADLSFSEDVAGRFAALGWHVQIVADGNDLEALDSAATNAAAETNRPSLVVVRTSIGYGSPNRQDKSKAHGEPLGDEERQLTKENLDWPQEPEFLVPDEARTPFVAAGERGSTEAATWSDMFDAYAKEHPDLADEIQQRLSGALPEDWQAELPSFTTDDGPLATRKASGKVLNAICDIFPDLVGGSADLKGSNNTWLNDHGEIARGQMNGRNIHFGVREHAMGSCMNGMALLGLFRPYGGTFLIFSDYMRPAIRLAALMGLPTIYVFTHDSIFLGEDGPTHQPISQLLSLRSLPNVTVLRPADANETASAWQSAIENRDGPTAIALTRQGLPVLAETVANRDGASRGGYVLADPEEREPELILIATGSEVSLALDARDQLESEGTPTRVVSMPSWEIFEAQDRGYREEVLPPAIGGRLAIEAGSPLGWDRYVGPHGDILAMNGFGASAPYKELAEKFGFTVANVVARAKRLVG